MPVMRVWTVWSNWMPNLGHKSAIFGIPEKIIFGDFEFPKRIQSSSIFWATSQKQYNTRYQICAPKVPFLGCSRNWLTLISKEALLHKMRVCLDPNLGSQRCCPLATEPVIMPSGRRLEGGALLGATKTHHLENSLLMLTVLANTS